MYRFYGSNNSRFFLVDHERVIALYHDDKRMWSHEVPRGDYTILGVGNNGTVALWVNREIILYPEGDFEAAAVIKKFSPEVLEKSSAFIDGVFLDQEGLRLCVCRITPKSKVSEKLFGALASVQAEKGLKEFEILTYDIATSEVQSVYKIVHPAGSERYFKWSISLDFRCIVVGNPRKPPSGAVLKYSIIDTGTHASLRNFELQDIEVNKLLVTSEGVVLLDAYQKGVHSILIVTKDKTSFNISPPANSEILHLAKSYVAFHLSTPPCLNAKTFENNDLSRISLEKVAELGIPYGILFNVRDSIIFLYLKEQQLCIACTELSTFLTEVKRCELTRQQRVVLSEAPVELEQDVQYSDEQSFRLPFLMEQKAAAQRSAPEALSMPVKREAPAPAGEEPPPPPVPEKKEPLQAIPLGREKPREPEEPPEPDTPEPEVRKAPLQLQKMEKHMTTPDKLPDKTELFKRLENLKLQHVMGIINDAEFEEKKQKLEFLIKTLYSAKEVMITSDMEEIIGGGQEAEEPAEEIAEAPRRTVELDKYVEDDPERQKARKLLDSLEERFILGEINEETYRELKTRYKRMLGAKKPSASPGSPDGEHTTDS